MGHLFLGIWTNKNFGCFSEHGSEKKHLRELGKSGLFLLRLNILGAGSWFSYSLVYLSTAFRTTASCIFSSSSRCLLI